MIATAKHDNALAGIDPLDLPGAGVDLFAVGKILGHADHQSTMRYSHLANDTLMKAVEAGAARMNGIAC